MDFRKRMHSSENMGETRLTSDESGSEFITWPVISTGFSRNGTRYFTSYQFRSVILQLEITESMTMNIDQMTQLLHELKALGIQIAVDDFGTGYSSLSYLKEFPIDCLKLTEHL